MAKIVIEKQCGCFKRSGIDSELEFGSIEEARKEAEALCEEMNETFCKKHNFTAEEDAEIITIKVSMND
jgi:tRNA threonylcarbamoyladenosine modification (KEOPS) complex  Pcc1 subunit